MSHIVSYLRQIAPDKAREDAQKSLEALGIDGRTSDWWDRIQIWVLKQFLGAAGSVRDAPVLWTILAVVLAVILFFVLRQRWSFGAPGVKKTTEFAGSEGLSLDQLRTRAQQSENNQEYDSAVLWWFRATAKIAAERDLVSDLRGMTATEVAKAISTKLPSAAADMLASADVFNRTSYGHAPATQQDAQLLRDCHQTIDSLSERQAVVKS